MNIYQNSIRTHILEACQLKAMNIVELIAQIQKIREKTTKQAVYTAIRKLKEEEIVVTHKKYISLNKLWIQRQLDFYNLADSEYNHNGIGHDNILLLEDRDKVIYNFHSPSLTDMYWGHIFEVLSENIDLKMPIIIYNPHEWFLIARKESEKQIFTHLNNQNKLLLLVSGNNSPIDKNVLNESFKDWKHQYSLLLTSKYPNNYYLNIFGDFMIEVRLDKEISTKIDEFYKKYSKLDDINTKELFDIVNQKGNNKLIITKNHKKAAKIRKKLSKDFYLPQGYII